MEMVFYIIMISVIVAAVAVCACVFVKTRKDFSRNDVHIKNGADIETGQISRDRNYFKGITGNLKGTVVINGNRSKSKGIFLEIININNGDKLNLKVDSEIVIGRIPDGNDYALTDDLMVSKHHCRLFVYDNKLYVDDLNSANHTYLNGKVITKPTCVQSSDVIRVGKTELGIVY